MLEDPWSNLVKKSDLNESIAFDEHNQSLSDSLRPRIGDSTINPALDVPENLVNTNDLSKYSYTFDQGLDESSGLASGENDANSYDLTNIIDVMLNDDITENDQAFLDLVKTNDDSNIAGSKPALNTNTMLSVNPLEAERVSVNPPQVRE